jgi:hypothetical protein
MNGSNGVWGLAADRGGIGGGGVSGSGWLRSGSMNGFRVEDDILLAITQQILALKIATKRVVLYGVEVHNGTRRDRDRIAVRPCRDVGNSF